MQFVGSNNFTKGHQFDEHLEVLRWSCDATNKFWRILYASDLWITRRVTEQLVKLGWAFCAPSLH